MASVEHTQDESQWFKAMFDYATIGIIVTNEKGEITNFNRQAEKYFGYSKEEIIHQPIEILLPPGAREKHISYRQEFYHKPSPRNMGHGRDLYGQRKDGSVLPVEVSLSHYYIENKIYVIAFVIDITVRKKQEITLVQQKEELERVTEEIKTLNATLEKKIDDRTRMLRETLSALEQSKAELSEALKAEKDLGELKSKFVSMASHEFKTPLSTILSSAYLLEQYNESNEPAKRIKHINRIKNAANDMKMILDDFLSLDKLDEGVVQCYPIHLTAKKCIEEIADIIQDMQINCKPGQIIEFTHEGNNDIYVDDRLLKNICINLISNAIKFSQENGIIKVHCRIQPHELSVSVEDNGIGISEEDQQHLFERFFRARNAVNIQGTGLGLHIIVKYLELMNGRITFSSKLDEGSTFTVFIPQLPSS